MHKSEKCTRRGTAIKTEGPTRAGPEAGVSMLENTSIHSGWSTDG